jgi:DNA-binding transcriptional MerR regulator
MTEREAGESNRQLQEVAGQLGVTDRQLRRWRDQGLLPKPIRRVGKGRAVGSEVFYPQGTCVQLVAVVRWFEWDRRVDEVKWALWCEGFEVEPEWIRTLEERLATAVEAVEDELEDFDHKPDSAINALARDPLPRWMRGREDLRDSLVAMFAESLQGIGGSAEPLAEIAAKEIGAVLEHQLHSFLGRGVNVSGDLSPTEIGHIYEASRALLDYAALRRILRDHPETLQEARAEAVDAFARWSPERAQREPPPKQFVFCFLIFRAHEEPLGEAIDVMLGHLELRDAALKLQQALLRL